jgi:hypothetical protein
MVSYLEANSVCHGDLSCESVLVSAAGDVKIGTLLYPGLVNSFPDSRLAILRDSFYLLHA